MIRLARPEDIPAMVGMTREASLLLKNEGLVFNEETFGDYAANFVKGSDYHIAIVSEVGGEVVAFIFAVLLHQPLTGEWIMAKAVWISKQRGHGRYVLQAAEQWARSMGAKRADVACIDESTERLLAHQGYKKTETTFEKILT